MSPKREVPRRKIKGGSNAFLGGGTARLRLENPHVGGGKNKKGEDAHTSKEEPIEEKGEGAEARKRRVPKTSRGREDVIHDFAGKQGISFANP